MDKQLYSNKNRFVCEDTACKELPVEQNFGFFRRLCSNECCKKRLCGRHISFMVRKQRVWSCTDCYDEFMSLK